MGMEQPKSGHGILGRLLLALVGLYVECAAIYRAL